MATRPPKKATKSKKLTKKKTKTTPKLVLELAYATHARVPTAADIK
jgi:hypothetical protein